MTGRKLRRLKSGIVGKERIEMLLFIGIVLLLLLTWLFIAGATKGRDNE
jgi:hypothetical protein